MVLQKILIIENSFRPGMGRFIAKGFEEIKDSPVQTLVIPWEESVSGLKGFAPDVVLINMDSLRPDDALSSALAIREESPCQVVIFISERENPVFAKEGLISALYTHAYWLNKPCRDPRTVLKEIERAYEGGASLDPSLLEHALTEHNYQGLLSPQQHRVMHLMSTGLSNAAIGRRCGITTKAVERTIASASKLLHVEVDSAETNHRVNAALKYLHTMSFI